MDVLERRRHRVFLTRNTEYHLRGDECVGVRDRGSGLWLCDHPALRMRALRLPQVRDSAHWVGRNLRFWGRDNDVVTSRVLDVERPRPDCLPAYVSAARAGTIVAS